MYEWEDDEGPSRGRSVVIGAIVVGLAALGWFVVRPALSDDDDAATSESLEFDDANSTLPAEGAVTTLTTVVAAAPDATEPTSTASSTSAVATSAASTSEPAAAPLATTQSTVAEGAVTTELTIPDGTAADADLDATTTDRGAAQPGSTEALTAAVATLESPSTDVDTTAGGHDRSRAQPKWTQLR